MSLLSHLDHIMIQVEDPWPLFRLFHKELGLPVAVDVIRYPSYYSGLVTLGKVNLEFLYQPVQPIFSSLPGSPRAYFSGLAFQPSYDLDHIRQELRILRVGHSPPIVFRGQVPPRFLPFTRADHPENALLHTNIVLGNLLTDKKVMLQGLASLARGSLYKKIGRLIGYLLGKQSFVNLFTHSQKTIEPVIQIVKYQHDVEARRNDNIASLEKAGGGELGVIGLHKVIVGLTNFEKKRSAWQLLLNPENFPLELAAAQQDGIQTIVLAVKSLKKAKKKLIQLKMLGQEEKKEITILSSPVFGLDIRLCECKKGF